MTEKEELPKKKMGRPVGSTTKFKGEQLILKFKEKAGIGLDEAIINKLWEAYNSEDETLFIKSIQSFIKFIFVDEEKLAEIEANRASGRSYEEMLAVIQKHIEKNGTDKP